MKALWPYIKTSLAFYLGIFLIQLVLFFLAPSFYLSSVKQSGIPLFIKMSFAKYFVSVLGLYLAMGTVTGLINSWLIRYGIKAPREAWRRSLLPWVLQGAQFAGVFLAVAVLYPAILDWIPGPNGWPLGRTFAFLSIASLLLLGATIWASGLTLRTGLWSIAGSTAPAFLTVFLSWPATLELPALNRAVTGDLPSIYLLGFDALDGENGTRALEPVAAAFGGRIYTNAFTPLPSTHPAWNSILTGLYPKNHRVRFFFESPHHPPDAAYFLSTRLKQLGRYQTLFASDQPETSYFLEGQGFDHFVFSKIGWEAHLRSIILNHFIFPAVWLNNPWVEAVTGKTLNSPSLFNYDLARFFNFTFQKWSVLPPGPRFVALHNCFLHSPIRLNWKELRTLPDYLSLAPMNFSYWDWPKPGDPPLATPEGWVNPYHVRLPFLTAFLRELMDEMRIKGYLNTGTAVLLSDHGERFAQGHEIYGGIHGIDIKTREQNNVLLAIFDPRIRDFQKVGNFVSLIDVTPTLLQLAGAPENGLPYDGIALLDSTGRDRDIQPRSIWTESMGFLQINGKDASFPQIAVQTLEESLIYRKNGRVQIGLEYYEKILKNKETADLAKRFAGPTTARVE